MLRPADLHSYQRTPIEALILATKLASTLDVMNTGVAYRYRRLVRTRLEQRMLLLNEVIHT